MALLHDRFYVFPTQCRPKMIIHTDMHVNGHEEIDERMNIYIYIYVFIYMYTCICMQLLIYMYIYASMRIYVYI